MDTSNLTEKKHWQNYWKNYTLRPISQIYFEEYIKFFPKKGNLIEIGGFPGLYAGYFKKRFGYTVTILDYIIYPSIIFDVEKLYSIDTNSIRCIEQDFLKCESSEQYDVVCSFGFVEHFENTRDIIGRHIKLVKKDGILLITIPNFIGFNGLIQKLFDQQNLKVHNLNSMRVKIMTEIMESFKLKYFEINYAGKPNIWLEDSAPVSPYISKSIKLLGKFIRQIPSKNSWILNPHMVIVAIK